MKITGAYIHKFSKKILNKDESPILKLGFKYSVPNKTTSRETVFSNFESLAAQISNLFGFAKLLKRDILS